MSGRIGLLGGTFDPIHNGHLDLAAAAFDALRLDELLLMPAHMPPHRAAASASSFHRFAMVTTAISGRTGWRACDMELRIAEEPSYSMATLERFHMRGYDATDLFFVIGADAFVDLPTWHRAGDVLNATNFGVVSRPGHPIGALRDRLPQLASRMSDSRGVDERRSKPLIFLIEAATSDVSSTAIRQRRAQGLSIAGLVHPGVEQHIEQHGLYAAQSYGRRRSDRSPAPSAGRLHD